MAIDARNPLNVYDAFRRDPLPRINRVVRDAAAAREGSDPSGFLDDGFNNVSHAHMVGQPYLRCQVGRWVKLALRYEIMRL